ncbi:MAG: glycosyltransferase family 2 protein [archaeon]
MLSIIIPVFNEKQTIKEILEKVNKVKLSKIEKEIIIVDDYSTDGTREELKNLKNLYSKIDFHEFNQGKGAAIRTALKLVSGDFVLIQDADLEYNPEDYKKLLVKVEKDNARVVYGSRFLGERDKMSGLHGFGNKFLTVFTNALFGAKLTDMETCYKLVKTDLIKSLDLKAKRFDFEPEITAKLLKRKEKIIEVPISYAGRLHSSGKKITWRDGLKAAYYLLKYRLMD